MVAREWIEIVAKICHEATRLAWQALGDYSLALWADAPDHQRAAALDSVCFWMANPNSDESAAHEYWMFHRISHGWTYGSELDYLNKSDPRIVPYDSLDEKQKVMARTFRALVKVHLS